MIINHEKCIGCGHCVDDCIRYLFELRSGKAYLKGTGVCMECGHCVAVCPTGAIMHPVYSAEAFKPYEPGAFTVPAEKLMNLMKFRRSVRKFTGEKLTEEEIRRLIEAGQYAPSAANLRRLRYIVITENNEKLTETALKVLYDAARNMERDPSLQGVLRYKEKWTSFYLQLKDRGIDNLFYRAPCVILTVACSDDAVTALDCGLAAANMELMANAMGLGACYIGFFSRAVAMNTDLADMIGLKKEEKVVSALAVGHPDVKYYRAVFRDKEPVTRV